MPSKTHVQRLLALPRLSPRSVTHGRAFSARAAPSRLVRTPAINPSLSAHRSFQTSPRRYAGIMPETENPPPREAQESETPLRPAEQTMEEFHERADAYLDNLLERLEQLQDQDSGIEVEYSAGVLSIEIGREGEKRNYIINKQPPNKQIWLSSPLSGPKRFDWVVIGEGQHGKEGAGQGDWVYLRDGTSLSDVLRKEVGVYPGPEQGEIM